MTWYSHILDYKLGPLILQCSVPSNQKHTQLKWVDLHSWSIRKQCSLFPAQQPLGASWPVVGSEKAGWVVGRVCPWASPSGACVLQVAEMHGELIEFNERLHRALVAKEALVSQMRQELIDLRGPVSAPALPFCSHCLPTTSAARNPSVTSMSRAWKSTEIKRESIQVPPLRWCPHPGTSHPGGWWASEWSFICVTATPHWAHEQLSSTSCQISGGIRFS